MRGLCGIDIDKDKIYFSFARQKGSAAVFLDELSVNFSSNGKTFLEILQANASLINQKMSEKEKTFSFTVEKFFLNLPWEICKTATFSATVPFANRKKITQNDINLAKKYLQDTYLDWDDFCIHNLILNYEIEGNNYNKPPYGVLAKKIKITSILVWFKDKLRKDIEDVFDNLEKGFGGMAYSPVSAIATVFESVNTINESCIVIDVGYDKTLAIALKNKKILSIKDSNFGLRQLLEEVGKKFLLPEKLAQEVFNRYISFKELAYSKEVSIKNDESYINLSIQAANSFVKDYIKTAVNQIVESLSGTLNSDFTIYFSGRLNEKEGFCDFSKQILSHPVVVPSAVKTASKSFGVLNYGISKFFDNEQIEKKSFLNRIMNIYKEYF